MGKRNAHSDEEISGESIDSASNRSRSPVNGEGSKDKIPKQSVKRSKRRAKKGKKGSKLEGAEAPNSDGGMAGDQSESQIEMKNGDPANFGGEIRANMDNDKEPANFDGLARKEPAGDLSSVASDNNAGECRIILHIGESGGMNKTVKMTCEIELQIGAVKNVRQLEKGKWLVVCHDVDQAKKARGLTNVGPWKVMRTTAQGAAGADPDPDASPCLKGVVRRVELYHGVEDFAPYLPNVKSAKRVMIWREGKQIPTQSVILEFGLPTLPSQIRIPGVGNRDVEQFIPKPLRCYKCQKYGHISRFCSGARRCAKCGDDHDTNDCDRQEKKCSSCGGNHWTGSMHCDVHKVEVEVQRIRAMERVSYLEARRRTQAQMGSDSPVGTGDIPRTVIQEGPSHSGGPTYAGAVRKNLPHASETSMQAGMSGRLEKMMADQNQEIKLMAALIQSMVVQIQDLMTENRELKNDLSEMRKSVARELGNMKKSYSELAEQQARRTLEQQAGSTPLPESPIGIPNDPCGSDLIVQAAVGEGVGVGLRMEVNNVGNG